MENLADQLITFGISMAELFVFGAMVLLVHLGLRRLFARKPDKQYLRQGILLGVSLILLTVTIIVLPISDTLQGQLFAVLALFLGAAIALSSAKPVGNMIAGISVRSSRPCSRGDYIRVGEYSGRVIRMDLLGIELQTEAGDVVYASNLYLLKNPVSVQSVRNPFVHLDVDLAYAVPRIRAEALLLQAARAAGLEQPVVEISALQDHAVSYRIAGRAADVHKVTEQQLDLRSFLLDALQAAGLAPATAMVPFAGTAVQVSQPTAVQASQPVTAQAEPQEPAPEISAAEREKQAGQLKVLKKEYTQMSQRLIELERELRDAPQGDERKPLSLEKKKLEAAMLRTEKEIASAQATLAAA